MWKFLKYVLAAFLGVAVFFIVLIFFLAGMAAAAAGGEDKSAKVEPNSILKLDLNYDIPEKSTDNPLAGFDIATMSSKKAVGLYEVIAAIRKAKTDGNIKGIYLPMGVNMNGLATLDAIRNELTDFKKSGKFIVAFGDMANQKSYYLATAADKIMLNPSGGLELTGFGREIMYYKNALDKLGIQVQEFHCGSFKSAIEPFVRSNMSDANREQMTFIYKDISNGFLTNMAQARKMDTASLNDIINNLKSFIPEQALSLKLVDQLAYKDELYTFLKSKLGIDKKEDLNIVNIATYADGVKSDFESSNKIAILVADGEIKDGKSEDGTIGGDDFAEQIKKLREDDKVKAIVLRINSPGGSALASDIMWRELMVTKKEKPIIVSFGDVAASGGYFIATPAERIFAQPNSITGSIGVFGLIPNIKNMLNDKLGVTTDQVEINKHGAFNLVTNPFDEEERNVIQRNIERTYAQFKQRVADGRKMDTAAVEKIAQGRVWTGNQAIANGLVDEIGTLDDAIKYAAKKANLKDYRIKLYPQEKSLQEQIAESFGAAKQNMIKEELGQTYPVYKTLKMLENTATVQMRLPYVWE